MRQAKAHGHKNKVGVESQTDKTKAKEMLLKAKELAPKSETGKRIDGILKQFFKDDAGDGKKYDSCYRQALAECGHTG